MQRGSTSWIARILIGWVLLCEAVMAADQPVSLRLEPYCTSPRSYSPILVTAVLEPYVPQLIEGTLHLRFEDGGVKLLEVRIPDIVLSGSAYTTTLVLPPMPTPTNKVIDVFAKFETADGSFALGTPTEEQADQSYLSLLAAPSSHRALTVAMVAASATSGRTPNLVFLNEKLSFETWVHQPTKADGSGDTWGTFACTTPVVEPELVPENELSLCAFDVIAVFDEGLGRLSQRQLTGLKAWVRAGGSLCVVPDGSLERLHVDFLNEILTEATDPPTLTLSGQGELVSGGDVPNLTTRYGLGRVAVLPTDQPLKDVLSDPDCAALARFLWKVRSEVPPSQWGPDATEAPDDSEQNQQAWGGYRPPDQKWAPSMMVRPVGRDTVVDELMPQSVRMVPLWLIVTMLVLYVAIVGPGDYLLLGLLRLRRYTWIVFPAVTLVFTVGMVGISNFYMGTTQTGGEIEINDVVGSGEIVRRSRIDLEFFGARRNLDEERENSFFTPVDIRASIYDTYNIRYGNPYQRRVVNQPAEFSGETTGLYYEGRVPARYRTNRTVRQWEPQLSRTLQMTSETAPNFGFDWENPGVLSTSAGRAELGKRMQTHDSSIGAYVQNGRNFYPIRPLPRPPRTSRRLDIWGKQGLRPEYGFLSMISLRTGGFFQYVSQVSPTAANNFEDLATLDNSDKTQWLLVVAQQEGDTQKAYRRLYSQQQLVSPRAEDPATERNRKNDQ